MEKLEYYQREYEKRAKEYLPALEKFQNSNNKMSELKELLSHGKTSEFLTKYPDVGQKIINVPELLYHGSPSNFDVLKTNISTQRGNYVYATDNPTKALFFAIFRNSSEIRGHIQEFINKEGQYQVKYIIDERIKGAIEKTITDKEITIYTLNGKDFFQNYGNDFIIREWVASKNIIPIDKVQVNIKMFFDNLEKQGLVEYNKYTPKKDMETILEAMSGAYLFQIAKGNEAITLMDQKVDEYVSTNCPDQKELINYLKEDIKKQFIVPFQETENNLSESEIINKRIAEINHQFHQKFMSLDENGNRYWDSDKVELYKIQKQKEKLQGIESQLRKIENNSLSESQTIEQNMTRKLIPSKPQLSANNSNGGSDSGKICLLMLLVIGISLFIISILSLFYIIN